MPLYVADLATLPAGTRFRMIADRADLFGGAVIECEDELALPVAPEVYPNGVSLMEGSGGEWQVAGG